MLSQVDYEENLLFLSPDTHKYNVLQPQPQKARTLPESLAKTIQLSSQLQPYRRSLLLIALCKQLKLEAPAEVSEIVHGFVQGQFVRISSQIYNKAGSLPTLEVILSETHELLYCKNILFGLERVRLTVCRLHHLRMLGMYYLLTKRANSAIAAFQTVLDAMQTAKLQEGLILAEAVEIDLAAALSLQGFFAKSHLIVKKAVQRLEKRGEPKALICSGYVSLSKLSERLGHYRSAQLYLKAGLSVAREIEYRELLDWAERVGKSLPQ